MTTPTSDPPYDPALLPPPDRSERCAVHAERISLDPGGTALWVDELIVADVSLPWPKPVWAKEGFTAIPELVMAAGESGRRVRVLAAVPLDDGVSRVVTHRLHDGAGFVREEHQVDSGLEADVLTVLLAKGLAASPATVVSRAPRRELLLCTQGSHDVCCGTRGPALQAELESINPAVAIRRVSHTGGHRMAPTGVTLPDGRMWGFLDAAETVGILDHSIAPASVAFRSRGWIGAAPGPAQVAERAVFAQVDSWAFDSQPRTVTVLDQNDRPTVEVVAGESEWRVVVAPSRAVPTIACGQPGGLPAKPGTEWTVLSITRLP